MALVAPTPAVRDLGRDRLNWVACRPCERSSPSRVPSRLALARHRLNGRLATRAQVWVRFGAELYAAAQRSDGQIVEVGPYLFSKPGTTAPAVPNLSFVARVGELGCGVGYYKQGWVERRALRVVR